MSKSTQAAKVIKRKQETRDTVTLRLQLPEPFDWQPGQFIMVQAMIDGESVRRAYSVSSSPTRSDYMEITIRETQEPTMSRYLNEIQVGQTLEVRGPYGKFIFDGKETDQAVFLAAGSGITPFRAFLEYIEDTQLDTEVQLLYSCGYGDNVIFKEELEELAANLPSVSYELSLTREPAEKYPDTRKGRIDADYLTKEMKILDHAHYYMCGTPGFVKAMISTLENLGVERDRLHREQWG